MDIPTQTEAVVKVREAELLPPVQRGAIRDLCRWAACLSEPLSAERCVSAMLGRMWEDGDRLSWRRREEWDYTLGAPVAREIARIGDSGAVGLLKTLAWLAGQRLEEVCVGLLDGLGEVPAPGWSTRIGKAVVDSANWDDRFFRARTIVLRITRAGEVTYSLVVFVDENGSARRLGMLRPSVAAEIGRRAGGPGVRATTLEEVPVEVACGDARAAIEDGYGDHRLALSETFADLRALALATIAPSAGPPNSLLYR